MKNSYMHYLITSSLFFLFILSGCGTTQPSRFYTLESIGAHEGTTQSTPADHNILVSIGPVDIPDYLDRPQIVSRTSQNELFLSEFDRWAGSLKDDIVRVLSENLKELLSKNSVFVSPWGMGNVSDYRVAINIRRFDVMPEGKVLLNAQWTIIGKEGNQILHLQESFFTEPVGALRYQQMVSSMSRALEKLSMDIAEGLKTVSHKNK